MSEKMEINIVVRGPSNSGKSRISYVIRNLLMDYGFDVSVNDFDMSPEDFLKICSIKTEETLNKVSKNVKVTISQEQMNRRLS